MRPTFSSKIYWYSKLCHDTTSWFCGKNANSILGKLKFKTSDILQWFSDVVKVNPEKSHVLLSAQEEKDIVMGNKIKNNVSEKLLGITIDRKLSFNEHVNKIFDKARQKLNALVSVSSFMSRKKMGNYESIH